MAGSTAAASATTKVTKASTKAAQAVTSMSTSMNTLSFRAQTTGRLLFRNLGLPLLAIGGLALKTFTTFERSMVKIEALVGISAGAVENFAVKVKEVARATGRGPQELADAMFFVSSAGLRGAAAMEVMEAAAKGAAIGLGETSVVADAATSAVNAYGSENLNGAAAVDVLTAAVREGKVEATRLTPAIGKAIPVASAMGIEFHEVAAAIAAMTRTGTDARTSAIQLRQIMQSILDPSRQTTTALKQMGVAEGELADMARRKGLLAVLTKLRDLSKDNAEAFADVFPNVRALAGAMDITGENLQENTQIFAALANSAGDTDESLRKVSDTVAHRMLVATADLKVSFTELGQAMVPLVEVLVSFIGVMARAFEFAAHHGRIIKLVGGLALLSAALGLGLIAAGRLAQAMIFLKAATVKASMSMGAATVSATGLGMAMKGLMIASGVGIALLALTGIVAMAVGGMSNFGVTAETAAHRARNLRDELRDVRTAGEEVINPIQNLTGALREFIDTSEQARFVSRFVTEFQEGITSALREGQSHGAFQTEDALVRFFFGRGDTPAVRGALRKLVMDLNRDIGYVIDSEGNRVLSDSFNRLFGGTTPEGGVVNDEALSDFLANEGEGLSHALRIKGILAADSVSGAVTEMNQAIRDRLENQRDVTIQWAGPQGEFGLPETRDLMEMIAEAVYWEPGVLEDLLSGKRSDWLDQVNVFIANEYREMFNGLEVTPDAQFALGSRSIEEVVSLAVGDVANAAEAIGPFADEMAKALRTGQVGDFITEWLAFSEAIVSGSMNAQDGVATQERAQRDLQIVTQHLMANFAEQLNLPPEAFQNVEDFTDLFTNVVRLIGEGDDTTGGGRTNVEELATAYHTVIGELERMAPHLSKHEMQVSAMNQVLHEWITTTAATAEEQRKANRTIETAFLELETAFARADKAAKSLSKRFDDLIGRSMDVGEAQDSLNDALVTTAAQMEENGGSIDDQTKVGRRNRQSIRDDIRATIAYGEALLSAGASAEAAQSQVLAGIGAIQANALSRGVTDQDLAMFFTAEGVTPERLALLFADDKDKVSEAFGESLDNIVNRDNLRAFTTNLFSGLGGDVAAGMVVGINNAEPAILERVKTLITNMDEAARAPDAADTGSPSKLFYFLGSDIAKGVIEGVIDSVPQLESVMKDFVDAAMGAARRRMSAVSGAITAVMNFDEAKAALADAERRHGGKGIDTDIERLTEAKLDRNLEEAERALRLGQGNIEDLRLAVLEAEIAIDQFHRETEQGHEVLRAQLKTVGAGQDVVDSQTQLRIEGERAVDAFQGMALAITDGKDNFSDLLGVTAGGDSLFMKMTSKDFRDGITQVREDMEALAIATAEASKPVALVEGADPSTGVFGVDPGMLARTGYGDTMSGPTLTLEDILGGQALGAPGSPFTPVPTFSGNSSQNRADITVNMTPGGIVDPGMGARMGGAAQASLSAAIQAGIENGILDSWMPGTNAWNIVITQGSTESFSPEKARAGGG